jgi:pimeloyl-ACP methyl ester carboxylesterase
MFRFAPDDEREWELLGSDRSSELIPDFEAVAAKGHERTAATFASSPRSNDVDRETLLGPGGLGDTIAASMRRAFLTGWHGHYDDNVAEARPWGFRVADIGVPVVIRHGDGDRWVNIEHGRWLAKAIPGARGVFPPGAGHSSIMAPFENIVAELVEAASKARS